MNTSSSQLLKIISTPLASIFGSGFLIIIPILAGVVGAYSVYIMAGICLLAYAIGNVIRYNIEFAEPLLTSTTKKTTLFFERSANIAIVIAYIVSVSLYLHIMSAFLLSDIHMDTPLNEDLLTTIVISLITLIGVINGLKQLEFLEQWALVITFIIIALLIAGFANYGINVWTSSSQFIMPKPNNHSWWETITIIAGTLIVVQGFETTRYLGKMYSQKDRISASKWSQIIATIVYLLFVALALPLLHTLKGEYNDDSLLAITLVTSSFLVIPLVIAASLSQFSAAVADTLAAAGDLSETTQGKLSEKWAYLLIGITAILLTWTANTFELVSLASRAFAFYYLLQCLVTISISHSLWQRVGISLLACILAFITIFAVPAG